MASLPEHWESDYDGSRWFFRYKPTGIIQYTFPKPGDEFPEHIDATAGPLDLPPEEKLVSQQQVKRRSTTDGQPVQPLVNKETDQVVSATLAKGEGVGFWFQPDYMYLGPGSYDISPVNEHDEEQELAFARGESEKRNFDQGAPQSAAGAPLGQSIQLAAPPGNLAELPTESTAQCLEELHPPPVELPDHRVMVDDPNPLAYANAFDIAPVELPTESQPADYYRSAPQTAQQVSSSGAEDWYRTHSQDTHATAGQWEQPVVQSSTPGSYIGAPGKPPVQYQPYNPTQRVASEGHFSQHSPAASYSGQIEPPSSIEKGNASERIPVRSAHSNFPSVLRPPQPPGNADTSRQFGNPAYWAQRQSISGPITQQQGWAQDSNLAGRVPSVLQPARGRPIIAPDNSEANRRVSPPKIFQPYKPYQLLHQNVTKISSAENQQPYRPASAAPALQHPTSQQPSPADVRPAATRTNTLPNHMPSVPFMGMGSQATASDPLVATTSKLPAQDRSSPRDPAPLTGQVDLSAYISCSYQGLSNSSDFPAPLRVVRPVSEMDATASVVSNSTTPVQKTTVGPSGESATTTTTPSFNRDSTATPTHTVAQPERKDATNQPRSESPSSTSLANQPTVSAGMPAPSLVTLAAQLRSPVERPSTSFSVVSDFSIVSEPLPTSASVSRDTSHSSRHASAPSTSETLGGSVHSASGDERSPPSTFADPHALKYPASSMTLGVSDSQPGASAFELDGPLVTSAHRASVSSNRENKLPDSTTPPRHQIGPPSNIHGRSPRAQTSSPSPQRVADTRTPPHSRRQSQGSAHSASSQHQASVMHARQSTANSSHHTSPAHSRPHSVAYGQISPSQAQESQRLHYQRRMSEAQGRNVMDPATVTQIPASSPPSLPPKEPLDSHRQPVTAGPQTQPSVIHPTQAVSPPAGSNLSLGTPLNQEGTIPAQAAPQEKTKPTVPGVAPAAPHAPIQGQPTKPQTAHQYPPGTYFMPVQGRGHTPVMLARDPRFPQQPMMAYQWHPQMGMQLPMGAQQYPQMAGRPVLMAQQGGQQGATQPVLSIRPAPQSSEKQQDSPAKDKSSWFGGLLKSGNGKKADENSQNASPVESDPARRNKLQKSNIPTNTQPTQPVAQNLHRPTQIPMLATIQPNIPANMVQPHLQPSAGTRPPQVPQVPSGHQSVQQRPVHHQQHQSWGHQNQNNAPVQKPTALPQAPSIYQQPQVPSPYTQVQGVQAAGPRVTPVNGQAIQSMQGPHPQSHTQVRQQQGWNPLSGYQPTQSPITSPPPRSGQYPQTQNVQQAMQPQPLISTAQHQIQGQPASQPPVTLNAGVSRPQSQIQHSRKNTMDAPLSPGRAGASNGNKATPKSTGGWGNTSGYDGSGWGDDDEDY